ncbi:hypothetical protein [Cupriavidus sp. H18C1]|uniref:hypothetical protein n=1 Tax=Cupriavidus sp. H18C1 TaxID=3241601 RepID=UPI003BB862C6
MKTHITHAFRDGNDQALHVPHELAYDRIDVELQIERIGDELRIQPVRNSLVGVLQKFAEFEPDRRGGAQSRAGGGSILMAAESSFPPMADRN